MNSSLVSTHILPLFAVAMGLWAPVVQGQTTTAPKAQAVSLRVNFVPVGDFPVSGAIIKNGFPVMVTPPPSELVPTPISIKMGKEYKSFALGMNAPSEQCTLAWGSEVDVLMQKGEQYDHYVKVKLPEVKEDVTVFLLRNQPSRDWQKEPSTVVFRNGVESFPLGSVRVINFSSVALQVTVGETKGTIAPKSMKVIPTPGSQGGNVFFPYQVSAKLNGADRILANTAASYDQKSRMNLVMYDRDGKSEIKLEGDDQPVKVVKYFELPYTAPVAPTAPVAAPAPAMSPAAPVTSAGAR